MDFISTEGFLSGSMAWKDEVVKIQKKVKVEGQRDGTGHIMKMISATLVTLVALVCTAAYVFPVLSLFS